MNKSKVTLNNASATKRERIVVVGAGLAGLRSAERLRELGFTGELVIIGAERRRPYHRPALSKQMLTGELRPKDLTLHSYVPLDAFWRRGTAVLKLDAKRHVVELAGDEEIRYDGLVIATGVQAKHLPGAPRHDPRVHVLRTIGDAIGLQRGLATGNGKVVVIGGGFTAGEVASTTRELGCDVTILSRSKVLLGKVIGNAMGEQIADMHRANGVKLEMGVEVTDWQSHPWGITMRLSNGKEIVAGTVVLAVGSTPAVQWLRGSGLTLEDGVLCRPTCHVVGASDIVAAGDVARWPNLRFEASPRRVEHWMHAVDMGRAAAESLLAGATAAKPFTPLPRFWSEQHGLHLQAAGMPSLSQDTIALARRVGTRGITGYVRNGRLIGIVGQDDPRGMIRWTEELKRELRRPETVSMPVIPAEPMATAAAMSVAEPEQEYEPEPEPMARPEPVARHEPDMRTVSMRREPVVQPEPVMRREPEVRRELVVRRHPIVRREAATPREPVVRREPTVRREPVGWSERPSAMETTTEHPTMTNFFAGNPSSVETTTEHPTMSHYFADLQAMLDNPPPHPSMPNTHPVARPVFDDRPEHPSRPNMRPVDRPMQDDRPPHPSMPNMHPVARPMSDAERMREQQMLEWQFANDDRAQPRMR